MATTSFITPEAPANPFTRGKQQVAVAPISVWACGTIANVLVFPTTLDQARLEKAFARAASFWPSVVGRYVKNSGPGGDFAIALTNSPIPFSTQTVDAAYPYPDRNVVQPDLGAYLPPLADDYFVAGADAPLMAARLTTLAGGGSVLGINWAHVLGDGAACHRFIEEVSLFYNVAYADLDAEDMPTLEPHVRLPAYTEQIGREFELEILEPLPLADMAKGYADAVAQSQPFNVILTPDEVAHIVAVRTPGDKLSDNDLIAAWWLGVLERAGQNLDYVVQTINYRTFHKDHPAFPRNLETLAANVAQMRKIPLPPHGELGTPKAVGARAVQIARTIRSEMNRLRNDPETMLAWLANAADKVSAAAREGKAACLVPAPGGVVVNSNLRYNWAIKFGQPSAAYHTNVSLVRFLRIFQANARDDSAAAAAPTPRAGARHTGDVELVTRVEWGPTAEAVARIVAEDRARWKSEPLPAGGEEEGAEQEPEVKSFSVGQQVHRPAWGGNIN